MGKSKQAGTNTAASAAVKPKPASPEKKTGFNLTKVHIIIILAIFFVAYLNIFDEKLDLNGDNICYYILGKALAMGKGYTDIHTPEMNPHNHFPPGYPFIISLFMRLSFDSTSFYNILNGIFTVSSIIVFYLLMLKAGIERRLSMVVCVFISLNAIVLLYSTINMSEIPFMFFSIATLYLLISSNYEKKFYTNATFLLMVACLIIAYYIRTTGITLLFAVIVFLLFKKRWMYALEALGLFIISIIPWQIRTARLGGNDYVHQLLMKNPYDPALGQAGIKDFAMRLVQNAARYITVEIPTGVVTGTYDTKGAPPPLSFWLIGLTMLFLIIYGLIGLRKLLPVIVIYIIATGGTLLLWPSAWFGIRFMMPVIPILIFLALYSLNNILSLLSQKANIKWSPYILFGLLLIMIKPLKDLKEKSQASYPPQFQNYFDMATWAGANLPANSVVCTRKPEFFFIFSNLKSTNYIATPNDTLLLQKLQQDSVHYVVVDNLGFSSTPKYLVPAIQKNPKRFKLLRQIKNPDTYLFRFD